tara:strand:- start:82 stop:252 length:171 start_codon:yes stop_codon:yes gene_type:complete
LFVLKILWAHVQHGISKGVMFGLSMFQWSILLVILEMLMLPVIIVFFVVVMKNKRK